MNENCVCTGRLTPAPQTQPPFHQVKYWVLREVPKVVGSS